MTGTIVEHMAARGGGKDVRRTVEYARIGEIKKDRTMITEDSGVERFAALAKDEWQKAGRGKNIIHAVRAAGVGGVFGSETMAKYLGIGQLAGTNNRGHGVSFQSNYFIKITHQNNIRALFVICAHYVGEVSDKMLARIRVVKIFLAKKRKLLGIGGRRT